MSNERQEAVKARLQAAEAAEMPNPRWQLAESKENCPKCETPLRKISQVSGGEPMGCYKCGHYDYPAWEPDRNEDNEGREYEGQDGQQAGTRTAWAKRLAAKHIAQDLGKEVSE